MMVQGFDAADPAEVSARDIVKEWGGGALESSQTRPQGGYGPLLECLLSRKFGLKLAHAVREVRWRRGLVEVDGRKAKRAIITLPLGVLQSGGVRFTPALHGKESALRGLASGPIVRVALRFREAFWEEKLPGVAFFHSPASPFPTFWTPLPLHAPLLTAWAGGPKAATLTGASAGELARQALQSIRAVFPRAPQPQAVLAQDWMRDPLSRGGYSYVKVGAEGARRQLARPLERTLYFAGEATSPHGDAGTVGGALQSGLRAARECLN